MREIKFRAWNIATKTMIDLKKITPLALNMDTDGLFIPFSDGLPLMQFTGLKDKNGKEIYEGDIVKNSHWNISDKEWELSGNHEVLFDNGSFKIRGGKPFGMRQDSFNFYPHNWEVIGNIYETPALLNQSGEEI